MRSAKHQIPKKRQIPSTKNKKSHLEINIWKLLENWKLGFGTSRKGFTLIELIIYIAISAVIVVAILRVMFSVLDSGTKVETKSTVQGGVRFAMEQILFTSIDAVAVNTGSSVFSTQSGSLSLAMSGASINPTVFSLSGTQIYAQEGVSTAEPLTTSKIKVLELRFTNLSATGASPTIRVRIHATDSVDEVDADYDDDFVLETSVTIRQ